MAIQNPFQTLVTALSDNSGLDVASCKILTCLFFTFPFSAIFKRLPDDRITFKNYYIIIVSAIFVFFILELTTGLFVLLFNSLFTYFLTKYYHSRLMPWVNLIALMLFLCANHVKAQFFVTEVDVTKIDITGAQMVLVMKLSSFGWSYWDGKLYHKDPEKFNKRLNTYQRSRAVLKHPSILPYLGYCFFYASLVTGPSFDYVDYERFILTDAFDDVPDAKKPGRRRKRKIPKSGRVALRKVFQGLFCAVLFVYSGSKVSLDYSFSTDFKSNSFWFKVVYLYILGISHRLKYYAVWSISEGGCIVAGLGYNGYDPKTNKMYWNRVQNIDPYAFEAGQNVHDCLEAWNMNTNKWLKNSIYLRTCARDPKTEQLKPGAVPTFITFLTSAFWHGTKPGYYMTFLLGAFMQTVGKIYRRNFRPMFATKDNSNLSKFKKAYDLVCWVLTQSAFGYLCQPFVILEFRPSMELWGSCYFWVHAGCIFTLFIFNGPYGKKVSGFLKTYHLQTKAKPEVPVVESVPETQLQKLSQLKEHFDSTTDLLEIVKKQQEPYLPDYDNQTELKDSMSVPDIEALTKKYADMSVEIDEWYKQSTKGKETIIDDNELEAMKDALVKFENDIKSFMNNLKKHENNTSGSETKKDE